MAILEHTALGEPSRALDFPTRSRVLTYCAVFGLAVLAGWVARAQWNIDGYSFRAVACSIGAVLVLLFGLRAGGRGPTMRRILLTGVLVAWSGSSLGWTVLHPLTRLSSVKSVQFWSVFHYYLGAKYFAELGYTGLYDQALAADADGGHNWSDVSRMRNLETYQVERLRQRPERSALWSDARWAEFKHDISFLTPYVPPRAWRNIFRDRGYNPPPSSTTLRRLLATRELNRGTLALQGAMDAIVLFVAFAMVGWVFGPLRALVCATWVALYFGNGGDRLIGAPFLYDYLAALLLAACALKRERPVLAGALLGYAAMMRVFPGILLVGLAWWAVRQGRRLLTNHRPAMRLATGFACACALLFAIGLGNGRGLEGWREFASKLTVHKEQHVVGNKRIGLAHLFTVDWTNPPPADRASERLETWRVQRGAWLIAAGALSLLWLWATARARRDLFDTTISAIVLVFCGVVLSRYYWSAACLLMLTGRPMRGAPFGGLAQASMAAALFAWSAAVNVYSLFDDTSLHRYLLANLLGILLIVTGLVLLGTRAKRNQAGDELGSEA